MCFIRLISSNNHNTYKFLTACPVPESLLDASHCLLLIPQPSPCLADALCVRDEDKIQQVELYVKQNRDPLPPWLIPQVNNNR